MIADHFFNKYLKFALFGFLVLGAPIAQLDRAVVFETKGSRFESWWVYFLKIRRFNKLAVGWRSGYLVRLII